MIHDFASCVLPLASSCTLWALICDFALPNMLIKCQCTQFTVVIDRGGSEAAEASTAIRGAGRGGLARERVWAGVGARADVGFGGDGGGGAGALKSEAWWEQGTRV